MTLRRNVRSLALFFVLLFSPPCVMGQLPDGEISGHVTAQSGLPIATARVSLNKLATKESRSRPTAPNGSYRIDQLSPGTYEITIAAAGFLSFAGEVTIESNQARVLDVVLRPAATITGRAPEPRATLGGDMDSRSVSDLPLNGRSASDVATLEPGVATARTQTSGQAQRGFGAQMTISGSRPRQNDSRLDGISVNDYANGPPGSALGVNLGVDAVEKFSVLSSNYPAQFGRSSGGIISAATRSGTNHFHGDIYEFFRNSALDARNFFDEKKPPFHRHQFGAALGGRIWKDRSYIFGDYEGLRASTGITTVDTVPSAAARAGNLSNGKITVDPNVLRFLNAFYPLPNGSLLGSGDTGSYRFSGQEVTPENYFTFRADHTLSQSDDLYGTYMFDSGSVQQPDEFNNKHTGYESRRQVFTLHENHQLSSAFLNSFRFGIYRVVARTGLTFAGDNQFSADSSFYTVPGQNAAGVNVPGLTTFTGGLGTPSAYTFHWSAIQPADDLTLRRGEHTLKLGVELERLRDNILALTNPGGVFSFNSLTNFLQNIPFSLAAVIPGTTSERGIRQTVLGTYLQDDWHLRTNITVALGIRYEMATVPTEVRGKLTVLRHLTDATPHLGDPLFSNPTLRDFEPRVGFMWDPLSNGKTTISAGFGIFDVLPLPYLIQFNEVNSAPFTISGNSTNLPPGSFLNGAFAAISASPAAARQAYFDPHPPRNYVMQWNLTIQREIAKNMSGMIGYVGSRGIHQAFRVEDADIVLPALTPAGYLWPWPAASGTRLNPNAGRIAAGFWASDSYYDALQLRITKNLGRRSHLGGSYTWGKAIDTSSGSLVGDEYANSISSPLWFNPKLNRGLSDFNVSHNLEANFTYEMPTPKLHSAAAWVTSGWQVGGVLAATSGVPFTPRIGGDPLGMRSTDPSLDVPNLIPGPGCDSDAVNPGNPLHYIKTQCFSVPNPITLRGKLGRNSLIGPGLINLDFSLFKNNYIKRISDNFNAQFRVEFFNVLNHTNLSPPLENKNLFDSSGQPVSNAGLITSTQTPSRQIQFALKLIW